MKFDYFIPAPIICKNCLRYGHIAKLCKAKQKCSNCTEEHDQIIPCLNQMKCKSCNFNHRTTDPACKERQNRESLKE